METAGVRTPLPRGSGKRALRLSLLFLAMTAVVVIPFVLFGDELDRMTRGAMAHTSSRFVAASAGVALLVADIVIPVPSTFVITGLGAILGPAFGMLAATIGLTLGCVCGYALGRTLGHGFAARAIGEEDLAYLRDQLARRGALVLALCRPVPVLAEASVIVAGLSGLAAKKVLAVTTLANVGVAAVYATLGARADSSLGFAMAMGAAFALPGVAVLLSKALRRRPAHRSEEPTASSARADPEHPPQA